jgi:hypothetical protein
MKRLFAVVALSLCMAAPSFASDTVGHSVKAAGKDSAKVVAVTAKDVTKARWVGLEISLVTAGLVTAFALFFELRAHADAGNEQTKITLKGD